MRLEELLVSADLVVESPGRGDLAAFGVDRDEVRARHPGLVVASLSCFGVEGPYAGYRWSDLVAQAAGWTVLPLGRSSNGPVKLPALAAMSTLGHSLACGALAGVLYARATGVGAHIDCAAAEALGSGPFRIGRFLGWEYRDHGPEPDTATSSDATLLPIGIFPCADGYVSMMSTPQQLGEMLSVLDNEELTEAFARPDAFVRPETKEILDAALYPWLFAHPRAELTAMAQRAGWPFAHVNSVPEVLEADHLHQRGFWSEAEGPAGRILLAGPPYRHAEGGWRLHWPGPPPGGRADEPAEAEPVAPALARTPVGTPPLDGHPGSRPDDGVVGPLSHAAPRRPRGRGHPHREPVGVPADDQGLSPPARLLPHPAGEPRRDVRAGWSRAGRTAPTTVMRSTTRSPATSCPARSTPADPRPASCSCAWWSAPTCS